MAPRKGSIAKMVLAVALLMLVLWACATAPVTGRSQLILIPEQQEIALGNKAFQQVLAKAKLCDDPKINALVERVGKRIARATDRPDFNWEFKVINDDKTANAFALPGGKVVVYTGILRYTRSEAALAFVLGHEIGHVIARHGAERMSQMLLARLGQEGLNIAVGTQSRAAIQAINQAYGLAATIGVLLPFSRTQEYEADEIGLSLMAKAGYDPREAPKFFERLLAAKKNKAPPTFLSDHPADEDRIERLRELIPEALEYYQP